MSSIKPRTRARRIRPFENRTVVLADLENPAKGTRHVASQMEDLERLIMRAAPPELRPTSVIYSCERSVFGVSARLFALNWRYMSPLPDPDGKNGPDNRLNHELLHNEFVLRSSHVMILGGDGKLVNGAKEAIKRGSVVYLLALDGSVNRDFRRIEGLMIVDLHDLGSL